MWVIIVEAANGDRIVEQYAMICDVEDVGGKLQVLADAVSRRDIERCVHGQIGALIGTLS